MKNISKLIEIEVNKAFNVDKTVDNLCSINEDKKIKLIKEAPGDDDDVFADIESGFDKGSDDINNQGKATQGELSPELKTAMVVNNVNEKNAILFNAYTKYSSKTLGAKINIAAGTIFEKVPVEKLKDVEEELQAAIAHGRMPLTWGETEGLRSKPISDSESVSKWQSSPKNRYIISHTKHSITPIGKEQIEFLARIISNKPDPRFKIEEILLTSSYKTSVVNNAEAILRDFYYYALIPIIMHLTKRQTYHSEDLQLEEYITTGIDAALDKTKTGAYNTDANNYGAWLMNVVKHYIIDKLKKVTDFTLDTTNTYEMLAHAPSPFVIQSNLDPAEAQGNFSSTKKSRYAGFWDYVYDDPMNVLSDLKRPAQKGGEELGDKLLKNPLQARFLRQPNLFYKSVAKDMRGADIEQGGEYEMNTDHILDVKTLPTEAKNEIYLILDKIIADTRLNIDKYKAKNFIKSMEVYKDATKNLMFRLLQYGGLVPVYAQSFKLPDGVRGIGSPVVYHPKTGKAERDINGVDPDPEQQGDSEYINYVWRVRRDFGSDEGLKTDLTKKFVEDMKVHNVPMPPSFSDIRQEENMKQAKFFVNGVYSIVKKYFGGVDTTAGEVQTNRKDLDKLLKNISASLIAEQKFKRQSAIKKIITNAIRETFKY